jgi:hypothetical protein
MTTNRPITNRESASIDARTRLHRTHTRKSLVSGRSSAAKHREHRFVHTEPQPLEPLKSERSTSAIGYQLVRRDPDTGHKQYAWFAFFGSLAPNAWQSEPCPVPFCNRAQVDTLAAQLGHDETAKRIGRGKQSTVRVSFVRKADVWVELHQG